MTSMCLLSVGGQREEDTQITVGSCLFLSTVARAQVFRLSRRCLYQLSCLRMLFLTVSPHSNPIDSSFSVILVSAYFSHFWF